MQVSGTWSGNSLGCYSPAQTVYPIGLNNSAGIQDRWTSPASLEEVSESRYPFCQHSLRDSAGLWGFFCFGLVGFFIILFWNL